MARNQRRNKTAEFASIRGGFLYYEDVKQCSLRDDICYEMLEDKNLTAIRVISLETMYVVHAYLGGGVEIEEQIDYQFTLRKETRNRKAVWYAYRKVGGKLFKRYVGFSEKVNQVNLSEVARKLPNASK